MRRGFRYQWFISSSLVLVMWAIAPFALLLVGGPTYASAVLATRILAIMVFLWSGTALANTIFFAHENTLGILGINAIQLVSVVMLYRLWVADWQLMGAVFADTVGQGLALVFCLWLAGRWFGFASKEVGRLFILSGLWVVAIVLPIGLTNYEGAGLFLWLGAGLGLLGSLLFLGGLPTPTDWHMMATIIQTPAWLTRFVQPVLYLLRRYQSFLRVTFKRHKRFKSRK